MFAILQDFWKNSKPFLEDEQYFTFSLIVLVSLSAFGLGRLSVLQVQDTQASLYMIHATGTKKALDISAEVEEVKSLQQVPKIQAFVGSKSGTVYYPAGCSGINRIKVENRVYFETIEEAVAVGRTRSSQCR